MALIISLFLATLGCENRVAGQKLAETGIQTANTLAAYYDSLAQDTIDIWEMEASLASLRGVSFDQAQQQLLQTQLEALNRRAAMARRVASAYSALKELSSYDASGEVKGAASDLADAMTNLPGLPNTKVSPAGIFASIIGEIAGWKQSRDIRNGSELISKALEKITEMFSKEKEAYASITEERGNKVGEVVSHLIENKMVIAWPLLQKVPDSLGLEWSSQAPVDDPETIKAMVELARVRIYRLTLLSTAASDDTHRSLMLMIENHRNFHAKKGLSLADVQAGLQKAQSYLNEISKLRGEKKQ